MRPMDLDHSNHGPAVVVRTGAFGSESECLEMIEGTEVSVWGFASDGAGSGGAKFLKHLWRISRSVPRKSPISRWSPLVLSDLVYSDEGQKVDRRKRFSEVIARQNIESCSDTDLRWVPPGLKPKNYKSRYVRSRIKVSGLKIFTTLLPSAMGLDDGRFGVMWLGLVDHLIVSLVLLEILHFYPFSMSKDFVLSWLDLWPGSVSDITDLWWASHEPVQRIWLSCSLMGWWGVYIHLSLLKWDLYVVLVNLLPIEDIWGTNWFKVGANEMMERKLLGLNEYFWKLELITSNWVNVSEHSVLSWLIMLVQGVRLYCPLIGWIWGVLPFPHTYCALIIIGVFDALLECFAASGKIVRNHAEIWVPTEADLAATLTKASLDGLTLQTGFCDLLHCTWKHFISSLRSVITVLSTLIPCLTFLACYSLFQFSSLCIL